MQKRWPQLVSRAVASVRRVAHTPHANGSLVTGSEVVMAAEIAQMVDVVGVGDVDGEEWDGWGVRGTS